MKWRGYSVAVCFGIAIGAQRCAQLLGYNEDKPTVMQVDGGDGGAGGSGGMGGSGGGCSNAADCPDLDDACQMPTCIDGVCGVAFTAADTAIATQTAGDCKVNVCDGAGVTTENNDDTDVLNDNKECTTDVCINGVPTFTPLAFKTPCGESDEKRCDGAGACKLADGAACTTGMECASGTCSGNYCCTSGGSMSNC